MRISFPVVGRAIPQGSKTVMRGILVDRQDIKTKTLPANRLKNWREHVARVAAGCMAAIDADVVTGPVELSCSFYFKRPPSHLLKSGGVRKKFSDALPIGDVDKYLRAIGDALSGVVYADDKQVVLVSGYKGYSDSDWVEVSVCAAEEGEE